MEMLVNLENEALQLSAGVIDLNDMPFQAQPLPPGFETIQSPLQTYLDGGRLTNKQKKNKLKGDAQEEFEVDREPVESSDDEEEDEIIKAITDLRRSARLTSKSKEAKM